MIPAPVIPNGCPAAIAPADMLSRSSPILAAAEDLDGERLVDLEPVDVRHRQTSAAECPTCRFDRPEADDFR